MTFSWKINKKQDGLERQKKFKRFSLEFFDTSFSICILFVLNDYMHINDNIYYVVKLSPAPAEQDFPYRFWHGGLAVPPNPPHRGGPKGGPRVQGGVGVIKTFKYVPILTDKELE